VKWDKGSFFKQRRFFDREDLLSQLREWLMEVNTRVPREEAADTFAVRPSRHHPLAHRLTTRGVTTD
jgi:hypothetical protein